MTGKLMFVPDTHVVVPKEPTDEMLYAAESWTEDREDALYAYTAAIKAAPQLTTPPVLRWEGNNLVIGQTTIAAMLGGYGEWFLDVMGCHAGVYDSQQEARRAAEKVLGFPDGLVVEEV